MTLAGATAAAKLRAPRKRAKPGPAPEKLLAWYDRHRRILPWREAPGQTADPYRVWLSEIMLQQTRVETVTDYFERFLARFPSVRDLAAAPLGEVLKLWAGLGYYARARNLHRCARTVVERHGGRFPASEAELRALPGIGPYTAAAIAAIAFGQRAAPVDGNVERVVARLFAIEEKLPAAKAELRRRAEQLVPAARPGDFAQAMMDLGATVCSPRRPGCTTCPWKKECLAATRGDPERYPRKTPKQEGRLRRGAAFFVLRADGAVLLRRRPPRGLLGGMSEVPTTEWSAGFDRTSALRDAARIVPAVNGASWRRVPGSVRHVFSHFPLELSVFVTEVPKGTRAAPGTRFASLAGLDGEALPALMRKVIAHALGKMEKSVPHKDTALRYTATGARSPRRM